MADNIGVQRYDRVAIALHWLVALGVFVMIGLGWYMVDIPKNTPPRGFFYNLHKSIGLTVGLMNRGLEEIQTFGPKAIDISQLQTGEREVPAQDNELLKRSAIEIKDDKGNVIGHEDPHKYKLIVALGSDRLPNGQYLYNPATGNLEGQWIQGVGNPDKAAAPQANLMATVVTGIIDHRLPWNLVLVGVFIVIGIELLGIRSLSFAVGFYISIGTTLAMFCGGVVRWLVDRAAARAGETKDESEVSPGALYASGLIAAGGVMGLIGIAIRALETVPEPSVFHLKRDLFVLTNRFPALGHSNLLAIIMFALLMASAYYFARKPIRKE